MDASTFRTAAQSTIETIIHYFSTLPTLRVTPTITPGYLKPLLPTTAPDAPEPFGQILTDLKNHIIPGLTHWNHPNFFAFFPASVTYPSLLAELFSAAFTAPAFNWLCSPACTELETIVLDWLCRALALPDCFLSDGPTGGGGVMQGSASEAIVVVMVAARDRYVRGRLAVEGLLEHEHETEAQQFHREDRAAELRGRLVALGSEQAHSSTQKAANILGVRFRTVPVGRTTDFRLTGPPLRQRIAELRAQGLEPFYLTTCLGTTATCAVDDFEDIAAVMSADAPDAWIHVDAAYAGGALICPDLRSPSIMAHLHRFDSFNLNMHKWLLVSFDASCLYIRDRRDLTQSLSITPSYLQNPEAIRGLVTDYRDWQIPLGRRFRALKIWFVMRSYGLAQMQAVVREHVRLGELFAELCRGPRGRQAGVEVISGAAYALTVLRVRAGATAPSDDDDYRAPLRADPAENPADEMNDLGQDRATLVDDDASNALTKHVYERINAAGEFFLTSGVVDGIYAIRVVGANPHTDERGVRRLFDVLVEAIEMERRSAGGGGGGGGV